MPPPLALILCVGFVVFLLYLDHRHSSDLSPALWICMIWLVSASSKSLAYWFGNPSLDYESGNPYDRSLQLILLALSLWLLARRGSNWIGAMRENAWLAALLVFMLLSCLWSPFLFVSFKRWVSELLAVVTGLLLSTEKDPRRAIQSVLRRTICILVPFSWLLIKYFPQYGIEYHRQAGAPMWLGVATQKNGLAKLAAVASFFIVWDLARRWRRKDNESFRFQAPAEIFILILSLRLLKGPGTYSATSVTVLVLGMLLFIWLMVWGRGRPRSRGKILMAAMVLVLVYGTVAPFIGRLPTFDISSTLGRESTLTGRSNIWATLVPLATNKSLLGHGWGGFWTTTARETFIFFPAHNGYLETVLQIGFVGLVLISLFMLSSCRKAISELSLQFEWGALWICWLIMALLHNITESSLPNLANLLIAIPVWFALGSKGDTNGMKADSANPSGSRTC